jgi:hypothetical protein
MRKMMILLMFSLIMSSALLVSPLPVFAEEDKGLINIEAKPGLTKQNTISSKHRVQVQNDQRSHSFSPSSLELDDLNEDDIDEVIKEVEEAEAVEDSNLKPVWLVWTRGKAWTSEPVTDAASFEEGSYIGMRVLATPIKHTQYGTLYKIQWGQIRFNGEVETVEGIAVLDNDNIFYLSLEGPENNVELKAIGRIRKAYIGYFVAMKGKMEFNEQEYSFQMRGRAIRLNTIWRLLNQKVRPRTS